ncbi:MAG: methyltransferase domain-containing protein [Candidatus Aminicenantes bacterium]|nr:MAG: methyltransferase domain-containing protein [Candidatus Aminicenantes bacterium]
MDKAQIREEILKIKDWRHPFELESGIWVPLFKDWFKEWHLWRVNNLMPTTTTIVSHIFSHGMKNAKVLDTGCWDGFYGFEFLKRGAKYLKGIDLRREAIRRANLIKSYFGYTCCDFEQGNIEDIDPSRETFDITLMFGLLYHLSSPIETLKRIGEMTNSLILIHTYALRDPTPLLVLKREDPSKDSTGLHALVTRPSEGALIEMLDFAGFDIILREYPFPFYERYVNSDFGFFYGLKSSMGQHIIDNILSDLDVKETYNSKLNRSQIVRLRKSESQLEKRYIRKRVGEILHSMIDKIF